MNLFHFRSAMFWTYLLASSGYASLSLSLFFLQKTLNETTNGIGLEHSLRIIGIVSCFMC